jgi:FtsZ-binding cell division protein ZapB
MTKKLKKYRVGLNSETYAISLVEAPAIEETLVALEKQNEIKVQMANEEKHMVYSAVLVPDKPIYRRNEDGEEFYVEFTKESIEHMSQQFFKEYKQNEITLDHETTASDITVVESWLKSDLYKDKSVALGLNENLPIGTWFAGMKVNQIDVWERIKSGELRGFSVESLIRLEEFSKQDEIKNNDTMINVEEMSFWTKMKEVLAEAFSKKNEGIEPIEPEALEAQEPAPQEPQPTEEPQPTVEEPTVEEPVVEEPKPQEVVEEPQPTEEPTVEEPKDNHLEELVNSLKEEIKALKDMNNGLKKEIKNLGKQPSVEPVNTNAKPTASNTYAAWREQMRAMIG